MLSDTGPFHVLTRYLATLDSRWIHLAFVPMLVSSTRNPHQPCTYTFHVFSSSSRGYALLLLLLHHMAKQMVTRHDARKNKIRKIMNHAGVVSKSTSSLCKTAANQNHFLMFITSTIIAFALLIRMAMTIVEPTTGEKGATHQKWCLLMEL